MKNSFLLKFVLFTSGLIGVGVGASILFIPHAFYASAGIALGDDANLLNEVRSSGGILLLAGLFILSGAFKAQLSFAATIIASVTYLSYGLSRMIRLLFDGIPNDALLQIITQELIIGGICIVCLRAYREII